VICILRIKRKDLEIFLTQIEQLSQPKIEFEQYPTSARVAANLLWFAGIEKDDLFGKQVVDLGCGTGILSIGAAYLGAQTVVGIDIDYDSLLMAKQNCQKVGLTNNCFWVCMDVKACNLRGVDTVIMNPPFGMRKESRSRDRFFLKKALTLAKTIYSINPYAEKTRVFFKEFCEQHNALVQNIVQMSFDIPALYSFHKKRKHVFLVDLYHIQKA